MTVQAITTEHGFSYLKCDCERTAIRLRTQSNGVKIYALQCLDCGRHIRAVSKNAPEVIEMPNVLPFDTQLADTWRARNDKLREISLKARESERENERLERQAWYQEYLTTTAWRLKRQAVMTRANNWCEGCRARQAAEVHHTTYAHIGDEFLFELVALCSVCHRRIHSKD